MYRIKEALIAMWIVLTHKHYVIASMKREVVGHNGGRFYFSKPAQNNALFWDALAEYSANISKLIKSGKSI